MGFLARGRASRSRRTGPVGNFSRNTNFLLPMWSFRFPTNRVPLVDNISNSTYVNACPCHASVIYLYRTTVKHCPLCPRVSYTSIFERVLISVKRFPRRSSESIVLCNVVFVRRFCGVVGEVARIRFVLEWNVQCSTVIRSVFSWRLLFCDSGIWRWKSGGKSEKPQQAGSKI